MTQVNQPVQRWMDERWRPQLHFSAAKNMINDPNGLIHHDGEFHLFYQYNQQEAVHWGHAVSTDLVHWDHQPPALFPDHLGQIYSGTAVVDIANDSGLGRDGDPAFLAFFTHANHEDGTQSQGMAYSTDRGRSWTMHPRNPLVPNPGIKDFRDPKVFRHTPTATWYMVVTAGDRLVFLTSTNLVDWQASFEWGTGHGAHDGLWECPDVFELPVDDGPERRWVVSVSVDRGAPAGGSGMQYFVGHLDEDGFHNDNGPETVLWQNWGADYYAGITWENMPPHDQRRLMVAWCDNWLYRADVPTTPFNGQLTVVRQLTLADTPHGARLRSRPVAELDELRGTPMDLRVTDANASSEVVQLEGPYEVLVSFDRSRATAREYGIEVHVGPDQFTRIGFDAEGQVVFVDRRSAGLAPVPGFAARHECPAPAVDQPLTLRVLVDRSSVEVFVDDGDQLTDLVLPDSSSTGFRPYAVAGSAPIDGLLVYPLQSIWQPRPSAVDRVHGGEWATTVAGLQGSSPDVGIALLGDQPATPDRVGCTVTIVGTRNNNPGRILGERCAGVVLGVEVEGSGTAVLLDRPTQRILVAHVDAAGFVTVLAAKPASVQTNVPHELLLQNASGRVTVTLDRESSWDSGVPWPSRPLPVGFLVHDAEVLFQG